MEKWQRQAEADLIRLSRNFAYFMDYRCYDDVVALFTPDAVLNRILHVHHGHDEIRSGLLARPKGQFTRHIPANFHFSHIGRNDARGVIYNISWFGTSPDDGAAPVDFGGPPMLLDFHDRYVRTDLGWRFAERIGRAAMLDAASPMRAAQAFWRPSEYI